VHIEEEDYDAVVLAVVHRRFAELACDAIRRFGRGSCAVFDIKNLLPRDSSDGRL
jgi:UDP-N-acetyl-D-galactosamine dehydrogenase